MLGWMCMEGIRNISPILPEEYQNYTDKSFVKWYRMDFMKTEFDSTTDIKLILKSSCFHFQSPTKFEFGLDKGKLLREDWHVKINEMFLNIKNNKQASRTGKSFFVLQINPLFRFWWSHWRLETAIYSPIWKVCLEYH